MTNPLNYIEKYPDRTKQIIGIDRQQWLSLLKIVKDEEERLRLLREQTKIRINKKGGGRPKILNQDEEICLCIYYLRHLPTFEILGMQFGVSKTETNDTFNYWLKIFRKILPCSILEQSTKLSSNRQMGEESLTEHELIVDSWEQARERPGDNQIQKEYYSGNKKQHTFKGQVIVLHLGKDIVGSIHFRTKHNYYALETILCGLSKKVDLPKVDAPTRFNLIGFVGEAFRNENRR